MAQPKKNATEETEVLEVVQTRVTDSLLQWLDGVRQRPIQISRADAIRRILEDARDASWTFAGHLERHGARQDKVEPPKNTR